MSNGPKDLEDIISQLYEAQWDLRRAVNDVGSYSRVAQSALLTGLSLDSEAMKAKLQILPVCEVYKGAIPKVQLEAVPGTRLCRECKE
jgi:hypothetical protein